MNLSYTMKTVLWVANGIDELAARGLIVGGNFAITDSGRATAALALLDFQPTEGQIRECVRNICEVGSIEDREGITELLIGLRK